MRTWWKRVSRRLVRRSSSVPALLGALPAAPAPPPFLAGGGGSRAAQLAAYQGWVYAAVNAIARRVAGVPLRLYRRGGGELKEHPLLGLLSRPNPILTGRQLRYTLVTHLELTGMAFLLVAEDALGRPAELWPLSPAELIEIQSGPDTTRPITAFVFQGPRGRRVSYRPEQILYFRHPSPRSLVYGASPIEAMAHAFDIDLAVRVYQRNFFSNAARPEVVLSTDQRLSDEEARRILTAWRQKHQGLRHVFEPTILDGGLKLTPLSFSAKDFEFMALAGWTRDNILAAYGVPAGKLGLIEDVNRASALSIDITFNSECVKPRLDLMEDVWQVFLAPSFGDDLVLRHDNPVPTDRAQAHREAMQQLDRGVITVNEYRELLGRQPVAWGERPLPRCGEPAPRAREAGGRELEAGLGRRLERGYARLLARFAGWSRRRVEAELSRRPELLRELLPPGLAPRRARELEKRITQCLVRGLEPAQALAELRPGRQEG